MKSDITEITTESQLADQRATKNAKLAAYMREYRRANPDKVKQARKRQRSKPENKARAAKYAAEYNKKNQAARIAYSRMWTKKNPEKYKAQYKKWRKLNKDKVLAAKRKYYAANPEKMRARWIRKYSRHKIKYAQKSVQRRVIHNAATPIWVNMEEINKVYKARDEVSEKSGIHYAVDHIVPLRGTNVCGLNVPWNLRIITRIENCRKRNALIEALALHPTVANGLLK